MFPLINSISSEVTSKDGLDVLLPLFSEEYADEDG